MAGIGATVALIKAMAPKADPAVIQQAVEDYLEAHPEISVADGSITEAKLAQDVAGILEDLQDDVSDAKNDIHGASTEKNRIDKSVLGAVIPVIKDGWLVPGSTKIIEANIHYKTAVFHVTAGKTYFIVSDSAYLRLALSETDPAIGTQCNNYNVLDNVGTFTYKPVSEYMLITYYYDGNQGASDETDIYVMDKEQLPSQIISDYIAADADVLKNNYETNYAEWGAVAPISIMKGCGINTSSKKIEVNASYNVAIFPVSLGWHHIISRSARLRASDSNSIPAIGDTVSNYNVCETNGGLIKIWRSYCCVEYGASYAPPILYPIDQWKRNPSYFDDQVTEAKTNIVKNIATVGKDGETFVFVTDSHISTNNGTAPALIKRILDDVEVHTVIHGGDVMDDGAKATEIVNATAMIEAFDYLTNGFFFVLGNHDENKNGHSGQSSYWLTKPEVYSVFYAKSEKEMKDFNYCYYYFDIPATKTRIIFVDIAYGSIDSAQKAWITGLLDDSTDRNVIICGHFIRNEDGTYTSDGTWLCDLTATYSCIKAIIHGHCHYDMDDRTENGVCVIGVDRDGYSRLSENNKYTATAGTATETAFDVMTVDYLTGDVYCQRLGRGKNRIERAGFVSVSGSSVLASALSGTLTWESSDTAIATVSGGTVTAVSSGTAIITAYDSGRNSEVWKVKVS